MICFYSKSWDSEYMRLDRPLTRRTFLNRSALASLAATGVTRSARASKPISANEKFHLGFIGLGGMGRSHFDRLLVHDGVRIVAGSDPDRQRQDQARAKAAEHELQVATYVDFREMLETHPDLDAVFVATPDHWHALASIHCMHVGLDVYCEKPLTLTIAEGQRMVETARRYGRICQVGTMQRSDQPQFRHTCELVLNGRIGAVERVVCFFGATPRADLVPDEAPPAYLDWDFYLGPAPWRPYNAHIHPYSFRYFRDYSGGMLTDWGTHLFDIAQWGLGKDHTSPRRVEAEQEMYPDNLFEFPEKARIFYDYGDVRLEWRQGTTETAEIEPGESYGTKFYGSEGEIFVNRASYAVRDKLGKPLDESLGTDAVQLYEATSHHDDFFEAMRTRKPPICDVAIGHRATAIAHLGNIAMRLGRPLDYEPDSETFPGDAAANRMIEKPLRAPWRI